MSDENKRQKEILKGLGKVQEYFPVDLRPYDPKQPNGSAGIVAQQTAPRQFEFGVKVK